MADEVTLRDYVDIRFSDLQSQLDRRVAAGHKEVADVESRVGIRLEGMNEFRAQISDERRAYLPREVFETALAEWTTWRAKVEQELITSEVARTAIEENRTKITQTIVATVAISTFVLGIIVAVANALAV